VTPRSSAPELHDVQGLVARGYGGLKAASFVLGAIEDGAAARRWLAGVSELVTAADRSPERRAVNIAFTSSGLRRLGLDPDTVGFSNEFVDGMTVPPRSRLLGDVGEDAPERWDWGGPRAPVDFALLLYAETETELAAMRAEPRLVLGRGLRLVRELGTSDLRGREPFGFRDGISQPLIEGLSKKGPPATTLKFGEFVLGYPNEYGRYTDRPILRPADDTGRVLRSEAGTGNPDLGHNGTYLVLRQLRQDVRGFWRFLDAAARSSPEQRVRLAAKLVGRWPGGASLALSPERDDASLADANDFGYFHTDRHGTGCPIGAHVRRANPRDSLDPKPGTDKSLAINRHHRILRRGREYGPPLSPDDALRDAPADDEERGLHFICLCANISRQFEFVQGTWVNSPKFAGLYDDADPLVGPSRPYGGTFTIQSETLRERITGVPRFVSVRGGAYFFLPGLAAVRYLASGKTSSPVGS
jgi:Dyp-type peroxidase family